MLARTDSDVKPQAGISFFLVDMNTPGVSVRPIKLIDGSYEVNDTFFDNVRVPRENLIGEEKPRLDVRQIFAGPRACGHRWRGAVENRSWLCATDGRQ